MPWILGLLIWGPFVWDHAWPVHRLQLFFRRANQNGTATCGEKIWSKSISEYLGILPSPRVPRWLGNPCGFWNSPFLGSGIPSIMQMAQGAWCHRRCASSAAADGQATSPWGTMEHNPTPLPGERCIPPYCWIQLNHAIPQFNRKCSQPNALKLQMRNANPVQASSNLLQTKCK